MFLRSGSVLHCYSSYQCGEQEFTDVHVSCFVGFTSQVWTSVLFTGPSLHLGSSSFQELVMGVCFYFHQLLDEGYRMAYMLVINLIIRGGHLR